jgi:histidinol phosphatase-like enzyme (inositol monophosphatase family)
MTFDLDRVGGWRGLEGIVSEVLGCGELAMRLFADGAADRLEKKGDRSPVTEADRAVEARLRAFLHEATPDAGFLGEESGAADGSALRWIVDPIDGTRAFVRGLPTWSILVGLEYESVPVLGVALLPVTEELFIGVDGGGATMNGRPLRVSNVAAIEDAAIGHGALSQFTESGRTDALARLAAGTYTQRGFCDFANYRELLLGRLDAVVDPGVQPYDCAPAAVLVREAGGQTSDLTGQDTIYGDGFLATNAHLHTAVLALV